MPELIKKLKDAFEKNTNADYKDKIFRYKLRNLYRVLLCVVLIAAIVIILNVQNENKIYTQAEAVSVMERVGTETSEYTYYNGKLLVYSRDGISAYNTKGEQLFNQTYEMQSPIISIGGDYVAVGDYKGNNIFVMDATGLKGKIDTNMMIQSLNISEGGVVTVALDDGETTWLNIYSQTGELIAEMSTTMEQTGYPLAYAMSPDNMKLAVSYLSGQSGQIGMKVAFYNFGDVGQNKSERLVSAEDIGEQIAPYTVYPDNENAIVLSDSKLHFFKGKQIPKLKNSVDLMEEVQSVFYNKNHLVLVMNNTQGNEKYRLLTYDWNGKERINYPFQLEYNNVIVEDEAIYIYNETELLILGKNGKVKFDGSLEDGIVSVIPMASVDKFLIVTNDDIRHIQLK